MISLSTGTSRWRERQCRRTYAINVVSLPLLLPSLPLKKPIARGCKASRNTKNANRERMQGKRKNADCKRMQGKQKFLKRLLKTAIARGCKASKNVIVNSFLLHVGGGSTLVQFCQGCQFFGGIAFWGIEQKNSTAHFVLQKIQEKISTCKNSCCALTKFSQRNLPLHT